MTNKKKMSFRLSKELDDWVKEEIKAGRLESLDRAVEQAVILLMKRLDGEK